MNVNQPVRGDGADTLTPSVTGLGETTTGVLRIESSQARVSVVVTLSSVGMRCAREMRSAKSSF